MVAHVNYLLSPISPDNWCELEDGCPQGSHNPDRLGSTPRLATPFQLQEQKLLGLNKPSSSSGEAGLISSFARWFIQPRPPLRSKLHLNSSKEGYQSLQAQFLILVAF